MIEDTVAPYMWYAYVAGTAGLLLATWLWLRKKPELCQFLMVSQAALLLTFTQLTAELPNKAPALFVLVFDLLTSDKPVLDVALLLGVVWVAALLVSLLARIGWQKWRASKAAVAPLAESADELELTSESKAGE